MILKSCLGAACCEKSWKVMNHSIICLRKHKPKTAVANEVQKGSHQVPGSRRTGRQTARVLIREAETVDEVMPGLLEVKLQAVGVLLRPERGKASED